MKSKSLKIKLIIWAVIIPLVVSAVILMATIRISMQKDFLNFTRNAAIEQLEIRKSEIKHYIEGYKLYLNSFVSQIDEEFITKENAVEILRRYLPEDPTIITFNLLRPDGKGITYGYASKKFIDTDLSKREYYKKIMVEKSTDFYISEGLFSTSTKKAIIIAAQGIRNKQGELIGMVSLAPNLDVLSEVAGKMKLGSASFGWLLDTKGMMLVHPDKSKNMKINLLEADTKFKYKGMQKAVKNILSSKQANGFFEYKNPENKEYLAVYAKIPDTNWVLAMSLEKDQIMHSIISMAWTILIAISIMFIFLLIFIGLMVPYQLRSLKAVLQALENIASNEADLRQQINIFTKDDLGDLTKYFNSFIKNIHSLIFRVIEDAKQVADKALEVESYSQNMFDQVEHSNLGINQIADFVAGMLASIENIAKNSQLSLNNIEQINEDTKAGVESLEEVKKAVNQQAIYIEDAVRDIKNLEDDGAKIVAVMEVINSIAEQTNLLALNAAIEAARAGEAGKGFAVVADEVRSLASRTHERTSEIQATINSLQSNIKGASDLMHTSNTQATYSVDIAVKTGSLLTDIETSVNNVLQENIEIASTTEEQTTTTDKLNETLDKLREQSEIRHKNLKAVIQTSQKLKDSSDNLQNLLQEFKV